MKFFLSFNTNKKMMNPFVLLVVGSALVATTPTPSFVKAEGDGGAPVPLCPGLPLPFNDPGRLKGALPLPDYTTNPAVGMCLGALLRSGFDVLDIDNYDQWWDVNEGYVQVAQTGTYKGIDSIKEYMSYGAVGAKYFAVGFNTNNGRGVYRIPIVMDATITDPTTGAGTCDVMFVSDYIYDLEAPTLSYPGLTNGGTITATVMGVYNYDFQFTSPTAATITINSMRGYFPDQFWESVATKFDTPTFREFMCTTLQTNCDLVWKKNGYNGNQLRAHNQCLQDVTQLPLVDDNGEDSGVIGGWKGASLGCRQMHMSFVLEGNDKHCPHVSEKPMKDAHNKIKCQDETYDNDSTTVDTLFNELELNLVYTIGQVFYGYDTTLLAVDP